MHTELMPHTCHLYPCSRAEVVWCQVIRAMVIWRVTCTMFNVMSYHLSCFVMSMTYHVMDMTCYVTWTADLVSTDMLLRTLDLGKVDIQICRRRLNNEV